MQMAPTSGVRPLFRKLPTLMPEFIPVLRKEEIDQMVAAVAKRISADYRDSELIFVGVLKGAFIFLSDLIRKISIPVKVDFIGASSYGPETFSSENIQLTKKLEVDIKDKDVLVIEDIVDTGLTLAYMVDYLNSFSPRSVKTCALIDKHERRKIQLKLDYVCHRLEKGFCVGYGLDYDGHYRNLPEIYHLKL